MTDFAICSECFHDQGLRLDAELIGQVNSSPCANCGSTTGRKLNAGLIVELAHRFFVWGTFQRREYGGAPIVQFNQYQSTNIRVAPWFEEDIRLIERSIGVGFFYYAPRLWMVGEVEPLKDLQDPTLRAAAIDRILSEYPTELLSVEESFYRIRKAPKNPEDFGEYDSPPLAIAGAERLDSSGFPVMYASQNLSICVHECRVTAEDELYVATLLPSRELRFLDLSVLLHEEGIWEFDSLDMAVHMLFLAGKHSYYISRDIAQKACSAGYDGILFPSYYSLLRTGSIPLETTYGISHRRFRPIEKHEKDKIVPNLAIFGRPIEDGNVNVHCINKLILSRVEYRFHFGPVGFSHKSNQANAAASQTRG